MRQKTFALFRETFRSLETLRLTKRKFRAPIYFLYCFPVRQCFLNLIIPLDNQIISIWGGAGGIQYKTIQNLKNGSFSCFLNFHNNNNVKKNTRRTKRTRRNRKTKRTSRNSMTRKTSWTRRTSRIRTNMTKKTSSSISAKRKRRTERT